MPSDDSSNSLLESDPQSGENTPSKLRSTEKPFSSLISTATISSIVTLVQIPYFISRVLSVGPAKFFGQKERTARPECLNDPTLGQHTFVKLKDVTIHCLDSGSQDKPLMLFLHGFPEMWYSWQHQIREFSKDYRTVAIDMRGYGESSKPPGIENYTLEKLAGDVAQLIPALGHETCVLVAHDWGGIIAQYVAGFYPKKIERLLLLNVSHPGAFGKVLNGSFSQLVKSWYVFFFQVPYIPDRLLRSEDLRFVRSVFKSSPKYSKEQLISESDVEAFKYSMELPDGISRPLDYYKAIMQYDTVFLPKILTNPTLMIWGVHDTALSQEMATLSEKYFQSFTLKFLEDAGHCVQQERPLMVNKYMRDFLNMELKDLPVKIRHEQAKL